jgi:carnitine-CoA ligase
MMSSDLWKASRQDTVVDVLRRAASTWGDRPFLDILGDTCTFADVDRESERLACGLRELGVKKGQTVVTILDNNLDAVYHWFAINKLGAISVPVNTAYKGEFLRHQVADAGARVIVAETDYAQRVIDIEAGLPEAVILVYRGARPEGTPQRLRLMQLDEIRVDGCEKVNEDIAPSDLAMLIYTGGTTGPSKGCMVSHNYTCNLARQAIEVSKRDQNTVFWTPLPLFHMNATATAVLSQMMIGGRCVIYPRFSVSNFWPEIERSGANNVSLLGSMIPMLSTAPDNDSMKRCFGQIQIVQAAPFTDEQKGIWRTRFGVPHALTPGYGLTECALLVANAIGKESTPGSSGYRNEDFDVRIIDDAGNEVPVGSSGEVIVRPLHPDVMFRGYWRRPEDTLSVTKDLWFHTGDIGKFDEHGCFFFVDRKKDYLRRRGENISSFEMETTFRAHPDIQDLAVHAVPSNVAEDDVKVTLTLRPGSTLTEEALCVWAIDRLPYFAVPRYIEFRTELPRNPVGRVLKYELRAEGVTPSTWDREAAGLQVSKR